MDNEKTAHSSRNVSSEASPKAVDEIRQSVLVVDDEENFLTLLKWFLTQRGYNVSTALSADEALDRMRQISQQGNMRVTEVASKIISSGQSRLG